MSSSRRSPSRHIRFVQQQAHMKSKSRPSASTICLLAVAIIVLIIESTRFQTPLPETIIVRTANHTAPQPLPVQPPPPVVHHPPTTLAYQRKNVPLPSCANRGRAKTFLLSFEGHSGSTAIMTELNAHPDVELGILEPLNNEQAQNTTWALETARAMFDKAIANNKTTGFKIRPKHVLKAPEQWRALAEEYDSRIFWQYRKNIFKDAIGRYSFEVSGNHKKFVGGLQGSDAEQCNGKNGCSFRIEDMRQFHIDLRRLALFNTRIARGTSALAGSSGCVLEVPYEDYLYDRPATMRDIFGFLGLEFRETKPGRFKSTADNLCEIIENWDEVCKNFYTCVAWSHLLEDPMNGCYCPVQPGSSEFCSTDDPDRV